MFRTTNIYEYENNYFIKKIENSLLRDSISVIKKPLKNVNTLDVIISFLDFIIILT